MKRILCALLAALLALLCGCSSFLEKEYLSVTNYDSSAAAPAEPALGAIGSYEALMQSLLSMVEQHQDSAQLQFNNYTGSISDDLAEACWQVKSASALGAYMVDYISYDISRIVTYYQATVYINYTRSAEEMEKIHTIGANRIAETVIEAVTAGEPSVAMQVYTSIIDGAAMAGRVENALLKAPGSVPVIPDIQVTIYSGSDLQRIFEVDFDYRGADAQIGKMGSELEEAVHSAAERISVEGDYSVAILAANVLGKLCVYDETDRMGTAYDVLTAGSGGSRAVAMAYAAICAHKGLDCQVVSGLKNNEQYYWNLVKVDDYWYHADVCEAMNLPAETPFLRNDAEMRAFRWDELDYPGCQGPSLLAAPEREPASEFQENTEN